MRGSKRERRPVEATSTSHTFRMRSESVSSAVAPVRPISSSREGELDDCGCGEGGRDEGREGGREGGRKGGCDTEERPPVPDSSLESFLVFSLSCQKLLEFPLPSPSPPPLPSPLSVSLAPVPHSLPNALPDVLDKRDNCSHKNK